MIIKCLDIDHARRIKDCILTGFPESAFNFVFKSLDETVLLIVNGDIERIDEDFVGENGIDVLLSSKDKGLYFVTDRSNPQTMSIGDRRYSFGDGRVSVIAGPCAVESYETLLATALALKKEGVSVFRAMPEKPRTSPYNFQGVGKVGFEYLARIKQDTSLPVLAEVFCQEDIDIAKSVGIDMVQIGSRNMQNYNLIRRVASSGIDCVLKKGMWCSNDQLLKAAEYFHVYGNGKVALCERGIQTHEDSTRNTFDVSSVAYLKSVTNHPIVADASHGTGRRELVAPVTAAAVLLGADAIEVEAHISPDSTIRPGDGYQMLDIGMYRELISLVRKVMSLDGRMFDWES